MHQRRIIRTNAKAVLTAALPALAGKIFTNRTTPVDEKNLPCINIFTANEPVNVQNDAPRIYERKTRLNIGILAKAVDGVDDVLDDLAEQVEAAINANLTLTVMVGGTKAGGNVTFSGTNGTIIPAGTLLKRDGERWATATAVAIATGTATVAVQSVRVGAYANQVATTTLDLVTPITGITGAVVATGGLAGGTNGTKTPACADMLLVETNTVYQGEGAVPIGGLVLGYDVEWYQNAPDDLTAEYPPLESIHAGWDLAPPDGTLEATDTVTLPQS